MSGKKALEICQQLKHDNDTKPIPVLIVADQSAPKMVEYYAQNVDGYLIKPYSSSELMKIVHQLIN